MKLIDRRAFLEMGLATGAGVAATTDAAATPRQPPVSGPTSPHAAAVSKRKLVVLDMGGGNDGLSMFPPKGGGATADAYRSLRTRTRIEPEDMLDFGGSDTVGMHKNLARIKAWKPAVILGVGVTKPDLSHFEMQRRWWSGDQDSQPPDRDRLPGSAVRPHRRQGITRGRHLAGLWPQPVAQRRAGRRRCP